MTYHQYIEDITFKQLKKISERRQIAKEEYVNDEIFRELDIRRI